MNDSQAVAIETPELMRRRLKAALRQARDDAGITQQDAADSLEWSVSKIIRIEQGAVGVSATDLRALLALYRIDDPARADELALLARGSRTREKWSQYRDVYGRESLTLFGTEGAARVIYKYEPTFVPGLFQTEEYAEALLKGLGHDRATITSMVKARLDRQELLERERGPRLDFVLGEAVVSRAVGSAGVMRRQLERIRELAARPDISVQVLLFSAGAHPGMMGAFTILEFADPELDDMLYLENAGGETVTRDQPELVAEYRDTFGRLQSMATKPDQLEQILADVAKGRF